MKKLFLHLLLIFSFCVFGTYSSFAQTGAATRVETRVIEATNRVANQVAKRATNVSSNAANAARRTASYVTRANSSVLRGVAEQQITLRRLVEGKSGSKVSLLSHSGRNFDALLSRHNGAGRIAVNRLTVRGGKFYPDGEIDPDKLPESVALVDKMFARFVLTLEETDLAILCGGEETELYNLIKNKKDSLSPSADGSFGALDEAVNELRSRPDFLQIVNNVAKSEKLAELFGQNIGNELEAKNPFFTESLKSALAENPAEIGKKLLWARVDASTNPVLRNIKPNINGDRNNITLKFTLENNQVLGEMEVFKEEFINKKIIPPSSLAMRRQITLELIKRNLKSKIQPGDEVGFWYKDDRVVFISPDEIEEYLAEFNDETKPLFHQYFFYRRNEVGKRAPILSKGITHNLLASQDIRALNEYVAVLNKGTAAGNLEVIKSALDLNVPFYIEYIKSILSAGKVYSLDVNYRFGQHEIKDSLVPHVHVEFLIQSESRNSIMLVNFYQKVVLSQEAKEVLVRELESSQTPSNLLHNVQPSLENIPVFHQAQAM